MAPDSWRGLWAAPKAACRIPIRAMRVVFSNPKMSLEAGRFSGLRVLFFREEYIASRRRGGGDVGIGFIDFQGLWEGRKTRTIVFRAFHKPPFPRPLPLRSCFTPIFLSARTWCSLP